MIVFLILLMILCLYKVKFVSKDEGTYFKDYLSIQKTNSIKGIFILIVFLQHFQDYVTFTSHLDLTYQYFFNLIGQRMVTLFMLFSGYGVMESIKTRGGVYM